MPLTIRSALTPLFGRFVNGIFGFGFNKDESFLRWLFGGAFAGLAASVVYPVVRFVSPPEVPVGSMPWPSLRAPHPAALSAVNRGAGRPAAF